MSTGSRSGSDPPERLSHYRLGRTLGSGGMGMVLEAEDIRDGSRVAIKLLHPQFSTDSAFRERFEREAHVAALLRSPYTVHLLEFGVVDGTYFLAMEFVDGETVAEALERDGPLPPDRALGIAISVARALEEAEARGVVHRDIKPENVMLTSDGMMKVADFGIARRVDTPSMTVTGGFVGTMAYGAPEQMGGEVDHRTDIYALGATLYCMLAGQPPFTGTALDVLQQHRDASLPTEPLAALPDAVVNPIRRSMEKEPVDRYQSASEFAAALERGRRALARLPTAAAPPPVPGEENTRPTAALPAAAPLAPRGDETVPGPPTRPPDEPTPGPPPAEAERTLATATDTPLVPGGNETTPDAATPPPDAPTLGPPPAEAAPTMAAAAATPLEPSGSETVPAEPDSLPRPTESTPTAAADAVTPLIHQAEAALTLASPTFGEPTAAAPAGELPTLAPPAPPATQITMTLSPRARRSRRSPAVFDLKIRNAGPEIVDLDLSATTPDPAVKLDLPARASVPAGGTTVVELRAKARKRRWLGAVRTVAFSAAGTPPGGGPPASVTGSFEDAPVGGLLLGGGLLGVGVVAAAAVGAVIALGGGDSGDGGGGVAGATGASETAEASATESASPVATTPNTATATPVPATATTTPPPPTQATGPPPTPGPMASAACLDLRWFVLYQGDQSPSTSAFASQRDCLDFFATAECETPSVLVSPLPGSTLTSSTVTFVWSGGCGFNEYDLRLGTSVAAADLFDLEDGSFTEVTVTGLPIDGSLIYFSHDSSAANDPVAEPWLQQSYFIAAGGP